MARVARIVIADAPHHLTQRGNNRHDVFFVDDDRRAYLRFLATQSQPLWRGDFGLLPHDESRASHRRSAEGGRAGQSHRPHALAVFSIRQPPARAQRASVAESLLLQSDGRGALFTSNALYRAQSDPGGPVPHRAELCSGRARRPTAAARTRAVCWMPRGGRRWPTDWIRRRSSRWICRLRSASGSSATCRRGGRWPRTDGSARSSSRWPGGCGHWRWGGRRRR
jgi:hypothetical protein